jgi:hypothetical protein
MGSVLEGLRVLLLKVWVIEEWLVFGKVDSEGF